MTNSVVNIVRKINQSSVSYVEQKTTTVVQNPKKITNSFVSSFAITSNNQQAN
jgi:hypothetical protein